MDAAREDDSAGGCHQGMRPVPGDQVVSTRRRRDVPNATYKSRHAEAIDRVRPRQTSYEAPGVLLPDPRPHDLNRRATTSALPLHPIFTSTTSSVASPETIADVRHRVAGWQGYRVQRVSSGRQSPSTRIYPRTTERLHVPFVRPDWVLPRGTGPRPASETHCGCPHRSTVTAFNALSGRRCWLVGSAGGRIRDGTFPARSTFR